MQLAGKSRSGELVAGEGRGLNAILARFTLEGIGELAAKHDERSFFDRVGRVVRALVEQVELHGGVVEAMSDDQLSVLFVGEAEEALLGAQRALRAARDAAVRPLRVAALIHGGVVNVGVVGADDWIAVHALGEAALVASAVGRWSARGGFELVVTDSFLGKLEERPERRYLGSARVGRAGHPAGLYELGEGLAEEDELVRALERGEFERVTAAVAAEPNEDPLLRAIGIAARMGSRDIAVL